MRFLLAILAVLAVTAGCGDDDPSSVASNGGGAPSGVRYTVTTTVLESPDHGPQLCLSGVMESYPPQCSGPDVIGWDWDAVTGAESANGTTWGAYTLVGTWDGEALTLTEPPSRPETSTEADVRFATPCPEPEGGWQVVDESRTSEAAMQEAMAYARSQPDVGGVWIDQSMNPAFGAEPTDESAMNDPRRLILNLTFTHDLAAHEERVRDLWGGALCVSEAATSAARLAEIRAEVEAEVPAFFFSAIDEVQGQVEISVAVDDGLQQRFDERYGPGVVEVQPQLRPVSE